MLQPIIVIQTIDPLCSWIFTPNFATMAPKKTRPQSRPTAVRSLTGLVRP